MMSLYRTHVNLATKLVKSYIELALTNETQKKGMKNLSHISSTFYRKQELSFYLIKLL
jgi:hypothetical protein